MPIIDSNTLHIVHDPSLAELAEKAREMRAMNLVAIHAAGSGHTGGVLSIMDITAALYLKRLRHDPKNPDWDDRDRVFWSVGHKAPALYAALGATGYFDIREMVKLRKLCSGFEGHPNRLKLPGIEASSGSLGQGLGLAVGCALRARLDNKDYKIFCIMGDGEQQEGSVWEAVMSAAHYGLDNLAAIVDRNKLQIDGSTDAVMKVEPLADKYRAFGWQVIETDGHDLQAILAAFAEADCCKGKPSVIIASTIKGRGVSYAENVVGYHGIAPKGGRSGDESLDKALSDLYGGEVAGTPFDRPAVDTLLETARSFQAATRQKVEAQVPAFSADYWWNHQEDMKVTMDPTRMGFGRALGQIGEDPRVVALGADITGSIRMSDFYAGHPERNNRFFSIGIAEQNMTVVAAGLAKEGKIPFIGSYGVFVTGRNWDQIRTTCCYNNYNVKIACAHGGISVGADGATHQALEDIAIIYPLPNMHIEVPCDARETERSTWAIYQTEGPGMIRFAREATPIVTRADTPFAYGAANVIRYRSRQPAFADAFDTRLAADYQNEGEQLCIAACGPILAEAMRAAFILKEEFGIETRVLNLHTVKPIDEAAIRAAAAETGAILTVEEHQTGGFGNIVAGIIARSGRYGQAGGTGQASQAGQTGQAGQPLCLDMVGIDDRFGESGEPWELMKAFGLSAEFIAFRARKLLAGT